MWRKMYHILNIGISVPWRIWKTEYILLSNFFSTWNYMWWKLTQHPRSVFLWHLDVCKLSVYMIYLMMFRLTGYFNEVEKQVTFSQHQFDSPHKGACCLQLWFSSRHRSVLALEIKVSLKGCSDYDLKAFC